MTRWECRAGATRQSANGGLHPPYKAETHPRCPPCDLNRVGGGVTPAVLPHHRTYGSVYGGSCLLTNSISELGSVDVSPAVAKRPDRPLEFPTPTS
ncbi:hypothetical protein DZC76_02255 [Pseudomonas sp. phDV1]|nr:hypothetical protein DZC76_02255 [Pseudomonas sp. phDV1]